MIQDVEDQAAGGTTRSSAAAASRAPSDEALALLRDVDHRVKNNMQLIASLILLQSRRTQDPAARQALKTVLERVNSVATVHRRLFQGDVQTFEVADFIRDLVGDLAATAGRDDIQISLDLETVQIPAASAAAFALVANELIGNALKHAFPEGRKGGVSVTLSERDGQCVLCVADDGIGLDEQPPGFGMTMVRLLCQQLHAELEVGAPATGSAITVRVPLTRPVAS